MVDETTAAMETVGMDRKKQRMRSMVRFIKDIQDIRIQLGNRLVASWMIRNGQQPGQKQDKLTPKAKEALEKLRLAYTRITDGIAEGGFEPKTFDKDIPDFQEFELVGGYFSMLNTENKLLKRTEEFLDEFPIWTEFLSKVKGIGPALAGVIISELDPYKAQYPSSFHKYAGYDVVLVEKDGEIVGEGRSRRKEHLEESEYTDKNGEVKTKLGITFNPFLKTKLYVLATSFIKQKGRSPYADIYLGYKNRLECAGKGKSRGHRHAMAMRYVIKRFLIDLHMTWRKLEGLPVSEEYAVAKLGIVHSRALTSQTTKETRYPGASQTG